MLKNILYFTASIIIFFCGIILYGVILNIRELTLAEALEEKKIKKIENPNIIIDRRNYRLQLFSGGKLIKSYKAVFGKNDSPQKKSASDFATPIGKFEICSIDTSENFYKELKINYPNETSASESLRNGYINKKEYDLIVAAANSGGCPPQNTKLGNNISIHGIGTYNYIFKNLPFVFNWTNGSIAISDESIDELLSVINTGTKVEIIN